jgi:TRAP-type C4-dicarboxylate transport system permease small subunit
MSDPLTAGDPSADAAMGAIGRLLRLAHWLGIYLALPALIGLIGVDVLLRYGLRSPLPWGNEVGSLLLLVVFVASLPYCTRVGGHVRMDLLYGRYSPRAKRRADAVSAVCGLVFAAALAYQSFATALRMYRLGSGAYLIDLPHWPFAALLGLSAAMLCLQFGIAIVRAVAPDREGREE